jgi:signal transduction histidine kinase
MLTRTILPNLRTRLVAVIFLALLPAFVLLLTIAALERTRAEESANLESLALAQLLRSQYQEVITSSRVSLGWLALSTDLVGSDPATCSARLREFYEASGDYLGLSVSEPDGDVRCLASQRPISGALTSAGQTFFRRALETREFAVGDVQIGQASGQPNLTLGYPILDRDGQVTAVIGAGLNIGALGRRLSDNKFYEFASLLLIDRNGTVVLRYPDPESYLGRDASDTEIFRAAQASGEGWIEAPGLSGSQRIFAFTPIGDPANPDLYAFAGLATDYVYAGVNRMLNLSLLGLTVIGLAALVSAWVSAELMIVRRTQQVVDAALRMRAGDYSARVGLLGDSSEMGQLAQTFDSMAAALEERDAENARLIGQMQQLNAELESRVIKRTEQLQISNTRLLETQADLRRLSEQLMQSTEQERTRMSREIHDQLGQLLTAIKMELRTVERLIGRDGEKARARIDETIGLVDETVKTVRRISADLRPGILDDFGLSAAIEWQLQQFEDRTGIATSMDADVDEGRISRDMATAGFRILQEALTNVARHAEATEVSVRLRTEDDVFTLRVTDNGRGLRPDPNRRSLGLLGMRERARQLGGSVAVENAPASGVTVLLKAPLNMVENPQPPQASAAPR